MIVPKKRVFLQPNDKVQLLYEGFNEVTDEEFFVVDDDAIIMIENGNEDLMLEYDKLENGNYQIGYLLEDHSQNDTLIFDPTTYIVSTSSVESITNLNHYQIFPKPTSHTFSLKINELEGSSYELNIFDIMGKMVHRSINNEQTTTLNLNLDNGIYYIEVILNGKRISDKLIIQK